MVYLFEAKNIESLASFSIFSEIYMETVETNTIMPKITPIATDRISLVLIFKERKIHIFSLTFKNL
ncbi:hypothetical protein B10172_02850 [Campylobacter jejuni]|nr:hypothetical protein B10172_02850 [Campylobacter jejuni]